MTECRDCMSSPAVSRQREHLASSNRGQLSIRWRLLDAEDPEPDDLSLAIILIFGVDIGFAWRSVCQWACERPCRKSLWKEVLVML
jgi:hypothetical protein